MQDEYTTSTVQGVVIHDGREMIREKQEILTLMKLDPVNV